MPAGQLDLLFDEVKIIEQPFGRGSDPPGLMQREGRVIESSEDLLILVQPDEEAITTQPRDDLVLRRDILGVARELFDAK
jgi:hypothetical protein